MDTRTKILDSARLARRVRAWQAAGEAVVLVESTFDPLLAEHAARVEQAAARGRVVAIVTDGAAPILAAGARAELAAALRAVAAVLKPGDERPALADLERVSFVARDEETARCFAAHVRARSPAESRE